MINQILGNNPTRGCFFFCSHERCTLDIGSSRGGPEVQVKAELSSALKDSGAALQLLFYNMDQEGQKVLSFHQDLFIEISKLSNRHFLMKN